MESNVRAACMTITCIVGNTPRISCMCTILNWVKGIIIDPGLPADPLGLDILMYTP